MNRIFLVALFALAACSTTAPQPAPGEPALELGAAKAAAAEPPAVVVRVKKVEGRFVAEVVDVKSATNGAPPPDAASRKQAVDRLQTLLGDKVKVIDPQQPPNP